MHTRGYYLNIMFTFILVLLSCCGPWLNVKGVYLLFNESPEERELPVTQDENIQVSHTSVKLPSPFLSSPGFAAYQLLSPQLYLNSIFRPPSTLA